VLSPHSSARSVLAIADFRRIWLIGWLSAVCRWLEIIGTSIFVYELTRSPQLVAVLAVVRMVPYVTLGLVFGGLADAYERTSLLKLGLAAMLVMCLMMAGLTGAQVAGYAVILAATFVSGTFWTIDMPVRRRLLVDAIGTDRMAAGLGIDNASMHAARMVGPIAGGLLYEYAGIPGIFLVVAIIHAACIALSYGVSPAKNAFSLGRFIPFSLIPPRELFDDRRFWVAMGVTVAYNLWCFPFTNMIPVIAQNDFALTPRWVGAMTAIDGIGGILGALIVAMAVTERTLFRFYFSGTLAVVLLYAVLSLHLTVAAAVPALLLIGIASAAFSATQYGLIYTLAPPALRGHATGVMQFFIGTSIIGHWLTGLLFERLGSVTAMRVMAGQAIISLAILWALWRRAARRA
jgi:predicted MFS family arabinose efflux permease